MSDIAFRYASVNVSISPLKKKAESLLLLYLQYLGDRTPESLTFPYSLVLKYLQQLQRNVSRNTTIVQETIKTRRT